MVLLRCPCGQDRALWGEYWWVGGEHRWVFFDDDQDSETYTEQVELCPGCGRQLERRHLKMTHPVR